MKIRKLKVEQLEEHERYILDCNLHKLMDGESVGYTYYRKNYEMWLVTKKYTTYVHIEQIEEV